jgi:hypothetical protein
MDFIYFLGRFHVLVLHLPIGILTLAIVFECLVRWRPFRFLTPAIPWVWLAGGISGVGTVMLGFMHATESGFQDSPAVEAHRWAGMTLTAIAFLFWILRLRLEPTTATVWPTWAKSAKLDDAYAKIQPLWAEGGKLDKLYDKTGWIVACVVTFVMMSVTGHLGGNLTHGETYLVQYAPKPIRRLAGLSSETDPRPAPKDLASADIYLDIVAPALHARCDACHNPGKKSGGLSIADYDSLMKGGKVGAVIKPGDPAGSNLFHRVSLPSSNADFMPKDGKTPLTPEQTAAVGVWIAAGAPKTGLVGALKLNDAQKATLAKALGLGGASEVAPVGGATAAAYDENAALPVVPLADAQVVAALENNGFVVRPVSVGQHLLDVDYTLPRPIADADLAALSKIGPQVLRLNLRRAGLTDGQLKLVGELPNLRRLRLEGNAIGDPGVSALLGLKTLRYLNLAGTRVSDTGLASLGGLAKLREVYVWQSAVTDAGVAAFRAAHPDILVDAGLKPTDIVKETRVLKPR